jgi:hypothetical protein
MLSSTGSGQLQSQHEYKQQQQYTIGKTKKKTRKCHQLRLFIFKREFLKISVNLQIALTAETHLGEGQWLKEQLNVVKL